MNYPLRSIAFTADLIHPPLRHQAADLQKLHGLAFSDPECQYHNFQLHAMGAQMSNTPGRVQSVSCCNFMNDRVQIREEMTGVGREEFESRLSKLAALSLEHLKIPFFLATHFLVRALVNPRHFKDTRLFMAQGLLRLNEGDFAPLGRERQILGIRFSLGEAEANRERFNLRIESFLQDPRSLFIENSGIFPMVVKKENLADLPQRFTGTYTYIERSVVPFLAPFDRAD